MTGNSKKLNKKSGFTLMEILVVLGISVILMTAIVNVFLLALRAQRQASERQNILLSSRALIENISRQIRVSEVDFGVDGDGKYDLDLISDGASGIIGEEEELHLIDLEGRNLMYFRDIGGAIKLLVNGTQETTLIDPSIIAVTKFNIFIEPTGNPFVADSCNAGHTPSGCSGASICSINDASNPAKTGLCQCPTAGPDTVNCATGNCVDGTPGPNVCQPFDFQPRVTVAIEFESIGDSVIGTRRINLQSTASSRIYKR